MPRQNRRRVETNPSRPVGASERRESWRGEDYAVRTVTGSAAVKAYRCPGCDQEIRAGVPHLVTWPAGDVSADERRHWHKTCWDARGRRAPGVQRTRNAPRY